MEVVMIGVIIVLVFFLVLFRENSKTDDRIHKKDFDEINSLEIELKFERMTTTELIERNDDLKKQIEFLRMKLSEKDENKRTDNVES